MKGEEDIFELLEFNEAMISDYYDEGWYDGVEEGRINGLKKGIDIGEQRGKMLEKENMVIRMFEQKIPVEVIATVASLSVEEVQQILNH